MPVVGAVEPHDGNVTTLNWIGPRSGPEVEERLGYGHGRLSKGFYILLLKQQLQPEDFIFEGTTLRSGGRFGLPAETPALDAARARVHASILDARGPDGYRTMQTNSLKTTSCVGWERIAKVLPVVRHDDSLRPSDQYPAGGGGLQWRLVRKANFLICCFVDDKSIAHTPSFSLNLVARRGDEQLANRTRLRKFLETA